MLRLKNVLSKTGLKLRVFSGQVLSCNEHWLHFPLTGGCGALSTGDHYNVPCLCTAHYGSHEARTNCWEVRTWFVVLCFLDTSSWKLMNTFLSFDKIALTWLKLYQVRDRWVITRQFLCSYSILLIWLCFFSYSSTAAGFSTGLIVQLASLLSSSEVSFNNTSASSWTFLSTVPGRMGLFKALLS